MWLCSRRSRVRLKSLVCLTITTAVLGMPMFILTIAAVISSRVCLVVKLVTVVLCVLGGTRLRISWIWLLNWVCSVRNCVLVVARLIVLSLLISG